ncbi:uncharacterized protein LOC107625887 isoform X1 [Arachis ipaensis]|nr:uncharacterized protein LOC107625887 isoform X1 [Arachis ipaensis]XP_025633997.1 uncharacterized protein LOC112728177 isoform X1 [Arachis hypogaea]XP_025633998.1 uncharacterized protein LOC112728177 isoform X1 [Arachis hypogaea]QHO25051.1 Putative serine/threonine-protein kinase NAK [Arachis hypogaea]
MKEDGCIQEILECGYLVVVSKLLIGRSNMSTYVEGEMKRSGSELNSQDVSDNSTDSFRRNAFPSMSQRPSNLRVFSVSELKCHEEFQPFHQVFVMHHPPSLPSSSNGVKNTLSEPMKYTARTRENSPRSSGTSPLRTLRIQSLGKLNPIDLKRLSFHMSPPQRATQNKKINEEPDREMEVDHKDVKAEKDDTPEL